MIDRDTLAAWAIDRDTLAAWAADALDPARRAEVERALAASPSLRLEATALRRSLTADGPGAAWRVPPPGLGLSVEVTPVAVLDARPSRVRVRLPPSSGPVVVLRRSGADWEVEAVLAPTDTLDLAVGHHWAVALAEPDWDAKADAARAYEALRDGIANGRVPVTSLRA